MRNLLRFVSTTTLALVLGAQFALAQTPTEASAGAREELPLADATATVAVVETPKAGLPAEQPKVAVTPKVQKPTALQQAKLDKKIKKVQKILNSRVGKWAVKRVAAKAERYALKQAKKNPKLSPEDINKIKEAKKLSGNLRIAAILGIIGIILTLLDNGTLQLIGLILIIIALILLLLELI